MDKAERPSSVAALPERSGGRDVGWSALLGGGCPLWCRNQSIFGHDAKKLRSVRRSARIDDGTNIAKLLGANVWRQNDQRPCRFTMWIAELMDRSTRCEHPVSCAQAALRSIHRVPKRALQHINALFVACVAMGRRNICIRRHAQFKDAHATRGDAVNEIPNPHLTDHDQFLG